MSETDRRKVRDDHRDRRRGEACQHPDAAKQKVRNAKATQKCESAQHPPKRLADPHRDDEQQAKRHCREHCAGVPRGMEIERQRRCENRRRAEQPRRPLQKRAFRPRRPFGAIVAEIGDNDQPSPGPGLRRQKKQRQRKNDHFGLVEATLADAAREILTLGHEDEDIADAERDEGDQPHAGRMFEHIADRMPCMDPIAFVAPQLQRRLVTAEPRHQERERAVVVAVVALLVIGESDERARSSERNLAALADLEGRVRVVDEPRYQ